MEHGFRFQVWGWKPVPAMQISYTHFDDVSRFNQNSDNSFPDHLFSINYAFFIHKSFSRPSN